MAKLVVTTPSPLAREILRELQKSGEEYKVYALGALPHLELPTGSLIVGTPSYYDFLRYLDQNPDVSEILFAAKLNASARFWGQALLDGRAVVKMFRERRGPSAAILLELIEQDMSSRNKTIQHPHGVSKKFKLGSHEQIDISGRDFTNDLREFVAATPRAHHFFTIEESWLYGVTRDHKIKRLGSERYDTASVLRTLKKADLRDYSRVVLYKCSNDNTQIVYPVIGVTTVQDAIRYGITDILITADCVIQGKEAALMLAQEHGISLKLLS